jgi:hypothetical protein
MKNKLIDRLISALIGALACVVFTDQGCIYVPPESTVIDNVWVEHKTDTLVYIQEKIPKPITIYKQVPVEYFVKNTDTLYITGDSLTLVPFNTYIDSSETSDYKFCYKVEVMGELVTFEPSITVYKDSTVVTKEERVFIYSKPDWSVTAGISNKANLISSVGYRGWQVGLDFNNKGVNQFFISKTFHLK